MTVVQYTRDLGVFACSRVSIPLNLFPVSYEAGCVWGFASMFYIDAIVSGGSHY